MLPDPRQAQPSQNLPRPGQPRRRRSKEFSPTKPRMPRVTKLLDNQIGGRIRIFSRIGEQPSFQIQRQPENGHGTATSSSTSTIANQPLALMEALMESAAPEGLVEQASWSLQDWKAHRTKLEKYRDWLLMAARQLTFPGIPTLCEMAQRCEWTA